MVGQWRNLFNSFFDALVQDGLEIRLNIDCCEKHYWF